MIKRWTIALCTVFLTLSMFVSTAYAASLRIKAHSGYKTFSPWGALGQVRIDARAEAVDPPIDPSKVRWNIGFWGGGISVWIWVWNGEWVEYPKGMGYAYAYCYDNKCYVTWATYGWSISHYLGFEYYSIYLYYDGHCVDARLWQFLVEIPWP